MNIQTIIVLAVVALLIGFAVRSILRSRKNGGCCGSCAGCSGCAGQNCRPDENRKQKEQAEEL